MIIFYCNQDNSNQKIVKMILHCRAESCSVETIQSETWGSGTFPTINPEPRIDVVSWACMAVSVTHCGLWCSLETCFCCGHPQPHDSNLCNEAERRDKMITGRLTKEMGT
jgi:hypothetical protein